MLTLYIILAFPGCYGALSYQDLQFQNRDLLDAADEVISKSFKPSAMSINFIIALSDETNRKRNVLINSLVARCDVVYVEDVDFIIQRQRLYNVIFIDDFASFSRWFERISSDTFVIDGLYLVIFVNTPLPEITEITKRLWSIFIYNVDFLYKAENLLKLSTYFPFSQTCNNRRCEKSCGDTTPVVIDSFNGSQTGSENYFPGKISDLFQCPVKVVTFNAAPMMMIRYDEKRNFQLQGTDGEMLMLLSESFNFRIDLVHISDTIR